MVRSPGPVTAGFGLDGGEVLEHLAVVALKLFGFKHYSPYKDSLSIYLNIVTISATLLATTNVGFHVCRCSDPSITNLLSP
jgi:hypothetical protein